MKNLSKLSKSKYLEGANLANINAEKHLFVANLCNDNNEPGIGIAHLVLGIEEFVKSAILHIRAIDNQLPLADLSQYFTSHKKKHESLAKFLTGLILSKLLALSTKEIKKTFTWKNLAAICAVLYVANGLLTKVTTTDNRSLTLDELRNAGFYVDLSKEGSWKAPHSQFSTSAFASLNLQVSLFISAFKTYLSAVREDNSSLETFIDVLINAKLLDHQQWLKILKARSK